MAVFAISSVFCSNSSQVTWNIEVCQLDLRSTYSGNGRGLGSLRPSPAGSCSASCCDKISSSTSTFPTSSNSESSRRQPNGHQPLICFFLNMESLCSLFMVSRVHWTLAFAGHGMEVSLKVQVPTKKQTEIATFLLSDCLKSQSEKSQTFLRFSVMWSSQKGTGFRNQTTSENV